MLHDENYSYIDTEVIKGKSQFLFFITFNFLIFIEE